MRVEISVGGGAWTQGGVHLFINQSVALRLSSTAGVSSIRWEIYEYPEGWTAPSGWSTDGNGVVYALTNGTSPPEFTPATVATGWGKWLIRIFANGSGVPVDDTAGLSILSPNGFEDVGFMEKNQFDTTRNWIGALKRTIRTMDAALTSGGGSGGGGGGGAATNPPSGTGSITGFDENHIYVWDMSETSNTSAFAQNGYGNASLALSIVGCSPGFLTTMGPAARFQVAASGFAYATRGYFGVGNTYELLYAGFTGVDASFFTAEFLIQPLTANMVGEFFLGDAAGDNKVQILYANTGINVRVRSAAGTELRFWAPGDSGVVTVDGESVYGFSHALSAWHHVMLTNESGTWKLYVDGVLLATRTGGPAAPSVPGMNPRFGVNKTGDARSLGTASGAWAYARNVRISKCARTLTYAQQVYNAAVAANQVVPVNPGPYVPPPYTSPASNPAGAAGNYAVVDSEHIYAWDMDGGGVGAWYNNTGHGTLSTVLYPKGIAGSTLTALGQAQLFEPLPYAVVGRIASTNNGYYTEYVAGGDDMLIYDEKWFSVEFLIQPRTAGMLGELFIGKSTTDKVQILYANTGINVSIKKSNGATTTFFVNGDANTSTVETQLVHTLSHALNVWHHVLLTCENGTWKLYADGVLLKTVTGGPLAPNAADMAIRFGADKASNTFSIPASGGIMGVWGACRNLRISKCARTATYAQEVCTSASVGVAPPAQAGGGTGTVQVWAGYDPSTQFGGLPNNQSSKVQTYTVTTDSWTNTTNFSSFALDGQSNVVAKNNVAWFLTNGSGGTLIRLVSSNATTGILAAGSPSLPASNSLSEPRYSSGIYGLGITVADVIYTLIQRTYNSTLETTATMYNDVILYSVISQTWAVVNSNLTASMDVSSYTTLNSDPSKLYYFETGHQYGSAFPATTQKLHLYSLPTTTSAVATYGVNGASYDRITFASATPSGSMASSTDLYFYTVPNDFKVSKMATATGVITARSTLPANAIYSPGAAWSDGCIQFSGGKDINTGTLMTTVWRYDINADAYIAKTALPGATYGPASVGV